MRLADRIADWRSPRRLALAVLGLAFAILAIAALSGYLAWPGSNDQEALRPAKPSADLVALPGKPGEAPVLAGETAEIPGAKARNDAIPFLAGPLAPARPFRFAGSPLDQSRATQCLALAALAEAGTSETGQRAVMQVVLNRVRHPAFARSVCGVVFQGAERATGCQFTFTCDGSLARRYSDAMWDEARARAAAFLQGTVFAPVGNATHYHADYVHPWWSAKLVKLARVDAHLFFRWPGYWGGDGAARQVYRGGEPDPGALGQSPSSSEASPAPSLGSVPPIELGKGSAVTMRDPTGRANFLLLAGSMSAADALATARGLCKPNATCRVMGWGDRAAIPAAFPLPTAARAALQFSFSRDPSGAEIALYSCDRFKDVPRDQCIPRAR